MFKKIKNAYKNSDKKTIIVYVVLRTLVLLTFVRQLFLQEWGNALLCLLTLILFIMPVFIEKRFKLNIPSFLEIVVLVFIFSAEILGEINNFYVQVPNFDTILHTLNGFICAGIGFSLIDLLNRETNKLNLSPIFVCIVSFCFSMTIGVLWEFVEFSVDTILHKDMQKDTLVSNIYTVTLDETNSNKVISVNNIAYIELYNEDNELISTIDGYLDIGLIDTMKDLLVNLVGAVTFSILGYLYILNRDKYKFVNKFIVTKE